MNEAGAMATTPTLGLNRYCGRHLNIASGIAAEATVCSKFLFTT